MWKFWLPLGAGLASGILIFSKLINRFLLLYPSAALWFFTGIVLGSLPFIASQTYYKTCGIQTAHAKTKNSAQKIPTGRILCVCAAFIAAFSLMIYMKYAKSGDFTSEAQTAVNAALWIKLCLYTAAVKKILRTNLRCNFGLGRRLPYRIVSGNLCKKRNVFFRFAFYRRYGTFIYEFARKKRRARGQPIKSGF